MEFQEFATYLFFGLMSGAALYTATTLGKLKDSIDALNINFAKEIVEIANVKKTVDRQEITLEKCMNRLIELEKKSFNCKIVNP